MKGVTLLCLACIVSVVGCGVFSPTPGQVAGTTTTAQCEDSIRVLRKAKAEGLTCEAGKAKALAQEPNCPLAFECPKNGGAE